MIREDRVSLPFFSLKKPHGGELLFMVKPFLEVSYTKYS